MMLFNFTVDFENGTSITDDFNGMDEFNNWVNVAIADFGKVIFIKLNRIEKTEHFFSPDVMP